MSPSPFCVRIVRNRGLATAAARYAEQVAAIRGVKRIWVFVELSNEAWDSDYTKCLDMVPAQLLEVGRCLGRHWARSQKSSSNNWQNLFRVNLPHMTVDRYHELGPGNLLEAAVS